MRVQTHCCHFTKGFLCRSTLCTESRPIVVTSQRGSCADPPFAQSPDPLLSLHKGVLVPIHPLHRVQTHCCHFTKGFLCRSTLCTESRPIVVTSQRGSCADPPFTQSPDTLLSLHEGVLVPIHPLHRVQTHCCHFTKGFLCRSTLYTESRHIVVTS